MRYLLDTNVISELRKGEAANPGVRDWARRAPGASMWVSVLVLGELRRGVESLRRRDPRAAAVIERWLDQQASAFQDRLLPVDDAIADRWGRLNVPDPVPTTDGLLAATALVHDLIVVTRNTRDFATTGAAVLNPFSVAS